MIKSINAFVTTSAMFAEFAYLEKKISTMILEALLEKKIVDGKGIHTLPQNVTLPWH
jgi:hypothetical protein